MRTEIFRSEFFHRAIRHGYAPLKPEIDTIEPQPVQARAPRYERVAHLREVGYRICAQFKARFLVVAVPRYCKAFEGGREKGNVGKF
jgi:hypothetical protein